MHAHNVANLNTPGFRPQHVAIAEQVPSGATASVVTPPPVPLPALPTEGLLALSGTDLAAETVNRVQVTALYRANGRALEAQYELSAALDELL